MTSTLYTISKEITTEGNPNAGKGMTWRAGSNYVGNTGNLIMDRDGYIDNAPTAIIDLSDLMSQIVGRQCPQTANYRVKSIGLSLRNVDDTIDNEKGAVFQGFIGYRSPTSHLVDAVQMARKAVTAASSGEITAASTYLSVAQSYTGFRFNHGSEWEVRFPTDMGGISGWAAAVPSGQSQATLGDILYLYNQHKFSGAQDDYGNKLWNSRVMTEYSKLGFSVSLKNAQKNLDGITNATVEDMAVNDFQWVAPAGNHLDVFGGLLWVTLTHSHTKMESVNSDTIKDEYRLVADITVEGWSEW